MKGYYYHSHYQPLLVADDMLLVNNCNHIRRLRADGGVVEVQKDHGDVVVVVVQVHRVGRKDNRV